MLSHLFASQLFGMTSGMHHGVNVVLHLFSAALLLVFLERATGNRLASAFVALLFAVHPLHVESVAWVAERKDVLSALFFFLALLRYPRYTESPSLGRYLLVLAPFGLGLLAKPMSRFRFYCRSSTSGRSAGHQDAKRTWASLEIVRGTVFHNLWVEGMGEPEKTGGPL
jgi:hypothetical protein